MLHTGAAIPAAVDKTTVQLARNRSRIAPRIGKYYPARSALVPIPLQQNRSRYHERPLHAAPSTMGATADNSPAPQAVTHRHSATTSRATRHGARRPPREHAAVVMCDVASRAPACGKVGRHAPMAVTHPYCYVRIFACHQVHAVFIPERTSRRWTTTTSSRVQVRVETTFDRCAMSGPSG